MPTALAAYLLLVAAASTAAVVAYAVDKRRAGTDARRIPERTLHLLALAGGWPGAIYAQQRFRHKTQKVRFRVVFWCTVALHVAAVGAVAYLILAVPASPRSPTSP